MTTIAIRFCSGCNNMLYPQGVNTTGDSLGKLVYRCRIWQKSDEVDEPNYEAYRICSQSSKKLTAEIKIVKDFATDPTLSRTKNNICPKCKNNETVFFQNDTGAILARMELVYVCTNCSYYWIHENSKDMYDMEEDDSD